LLTHTSSNQLSNFFVLSQASLMIFCDAGCGKLLPCISMSAAVLAARLGRSLTRKKPR